MLVYKQVYGVLFNFIFFLFDVVEHGHRRDSKYVAELRTVFENAFDLDQWLGLKLKAILKMFNYHKLDTFEEMLVEELIEQRTKQKKK